jgi:hypothetical protein
MSSRTVRRKVPVRPVSTAVIDLAVALHAMTVADREQRVLDEDRKIERGAGNEFGCRICRRSGAVAWSRSCPMPAAARCP